MWLEIIRKLGRKAINFLKASGQILFFGLEAVSLILHGKIRIKETIKQIYELGLEAFWIVSISSLATGMVLAVQSAAILSRFGARQYISKLVALSLVRELGPVLGSIIFTGKSGAKISAEIGAMSVNDQLLAARTLGINPMDMFATPKILACLIVLPLLIFWSELIGILGGLVTSVLQEHVSVSSYLYQTYNCIRFVDFLGGMIKTIFFSLIVGIICCFKGFKTQGGSTGVGKYTTEAVALTTILIIISDFLLTKAILSLWG